MQCCESNDLDEIEYSENILVDDAHLMLYRSFKVRLKNTSSGFIWVRGLSQLAEKSSKTWCILSAGGRGWLHFFLLIFCSAKKNGIIVCTTHFCNWNFLASLNYLKCIYPLGFLGNNGRQGGGNSSSRRTRGRWRPCLPGTHPLPVRGNLRHIVTEQQAPVCFVYQYPSLH